MEFFFLSKSETENKRIQKEVILEGGSIDKKKGKLFPDFLYWVLNG
jgi:hypothetical protein